MRGSSKDQVEVSESSARDVTFVPPQDEVVSFALRLGRQRSGVRAGLRFGQGEGSEILPGGEFGKHAAFLHVVAEARNEPRHHRVDGNKDRGTEIVLRHRLEESCARHR
jgi:hypothetical protein